MIDWDEHDAMWTSHLREEAHLEAERRRCAAARIEAYDDAVAGALATLADNLAVGAGLCRSFDLGALDVTEESYHEVSRWRPGCRRTAP